MSWIPGWDSIAGAGLWSGIFFWASIVSLIGLGISEVASHRYSDRKDELVELQQIADKKQHDDEIAAVHNETAQITERAARLEKEAAAANERAAEIMKATAWRQFTPPQIAALTSALSNQSGKYVGAWIANDPESFFLAFQFINLLHSFQGKWDMVNSAKVYPANIVWGIHIPDVAGAEATVQALRDAFKQAGVSFSTDPLPQESTHMDQAIRPYLSVVQSYFLALDCHRLPKPQTDRCPVA